MTAQNVLKKTETMKLQQLSITNPALLDYMEKLSQSTEYPLCFEKRNDDLYYLSIQIIAENIYLYVFSEEHFLNLDRTIGFFEYKKNMFIVVGDNVPDWFSKTDSFRSFDFTSLLGINTENDKVLPLLKDGIDDSRVAILYEYSDGILKLKKIIHGFNNSPLKIHHIG